MSTLMVRSKTHGFLKVVVKLHDDVAKGVFIASEGRQLTPSSSGQARCAHRYDANPAATLRCSLGMTKSFKAFVFSPTSLIHFFCFCRSFKSVSRFAGVANSISSTETCPCHFTYPRRNGVRVAGRRKDERRATEKVKTRIFHNADDQQQQQGHTSGSLMWKEVLHN